MLALKQQMVGEVFDKAFHMLVNLPEAQYVAFLARLAARASSSGDEEIVLNARDRAAVGEKVLAAANALIPNGKRTLSADTGAFAGGLILRRGSVEANCTVELLIELARGEMSSDIARVLFG